MRLHLDDNASEALRFLMLGAGAILLVRGAYWAATQWLLVPMQEDDLEQVAATFHNGYLITERHAVVAGGMDVIGRSALALITTLAGAGLFALGGALVARVRGVATLPSTVAGARAGLVIFGAWTLFAILFLPPRMAILSDEGITWRSRRSLMHEVALPWPVSETALTYPELDAIRTRSVASTLDGCGSREQVVAHRGDSVHVIAQLVPTGPHCIASRSEAGDRSARLAGLLEARRTR